MLAFNPQPPGGQTASMSGCFTVSTAAVGSPTNSLLSFGQVSSAFRWRAGNLTNRAAQGQFIRSMHTPVDRIRPVEVQKQVVVAYDNFDPYEMEPPFMWSMGVLQLLAETEQFDWGGKSPGATFSGYESIVYFDLSQQLALNYMHQDVESDNQGPPVMTAAGVNLMGFRGFRALKAAMGSPDDWSFNPAAVTPAIKAFDDVDQAIPQQAVGFMSDETEKDNWGWLPPMAQVVLDEAHLDHRFWFDSPTELEAITEDFIAEMISIDELYTGQMNISPVYQEDEVFGFQTAVVYQDELIPPPLMQSAFDTEQSNPVPVAVGGGGSQGYAYWGFWSLRAGMGSEFETWGFDTPTVLIDADEQDIIKAYTIVDDVDTFGFQTAVVVAISAFDQDELPLGIKGLYAEEEVIGFDTQFVSVQEELPSSQDTAKPYDDNQGVIIGQSFGDTQEQDFSFVLRVNQDDEQFGKQPPFIPSFPSDDSLDQHAQNWFAKDQIEEFGFNTPEVEGELLLEEETQMSNRPYLLWQQIEDEQFGKQAPFITSQPFDDTDQMGQTWWARDQVEDNQIGQNPPFLTSIGFDDIDHYPTLRFITDDVDVFGFQTPQLIVQDVDDTPQSKLFIITDDDQLSFQPVFVMDDIVIPVQQVIDIQSTDEDSAQSTFFTTETYADFEEQSYWQRSHWLGIEDELLVFSTPTLKLPFDTDFNPTMQQSYIFQMEDLEKYNWGWLPPMAKVTEDDSPYDSRTQLQSYFIPAIEDEQFSWGFDRSRFYALGDEAPYFTPAQMRSYFVPELDTDVNEAITEDFIHEMVSFEPLYLVVLPALFGVPEDDQFGFRQAAVTAFDQDELPPIPILTIGYDFDEGRVTDWAITADEVHPSQLIMATSDGTEQFGFETPFVAVDEVINPIQKVIVQDDELFGERPPFLVTIGFDDSPEQIAGKPYLVGDVETFGFQQQFPLDASLLDESIVLKKVIYGETEHDVFGFQTAFVMALDDGPDHLPNVIKIVDDIEAFGFNTQFTFDTTLDENIIAQWQVSFDDTEPIGQNPPFLETIGLEAEEANLLNPPYPVTYQLENDQIGQNPPFIISMPSAWEEAGLPPSPPWPITDPTIHDGWIRFIRKIKAVFGFGKIKPILSSAQISSDSSTGEVSNSTSEGSNQGIQGTGSVEKVKGSN